jgi:uncharacterized protein (UPF0276 family)
MMSGEYLNRKSRPAVALGTTYEGRDPRLLERILPLVDYIEVTPDSIAEVSGDDVVLNAEIMAELENVGSAVRIGAHGVGLSIGSHNGWSPLYIRLLDQLMERLNLTWHSEHLGYTLVDGENLGTMLAVPKTEEALAMVCARVQALQQRYPLPFLLENIVHILPDHPAEMSDAAFLNALAARTGCHLILDIYNLECDAHNAGFDIPAFLAELDLSAVRELHLACGVEYEGFLLDVHSRVTRDSTVELAAEVVRRAEGAIEIVTYELLPEAVPTLGHDAIIDELRRLRAVFCD